MMKLLKRSIYLFMIAAVVCLCLTACETKEQNSDIKEEEPRTSTAVEEKKEEQVVEVKKEETISKTQTTDTGFSGFFTSSDKNIKYIFLPNGEMAYIYDKSALYKVMPGTYYIDDNTIYFSTSDFINWFEGYYYGSFLTIVDDNTLEYGSEEYGNLQQYTRDTSEIKGTYPGSNGSISFDNGEFTIEYDDVIPQKGNYEVNGNTITLNYTSLKKDSDTLLILDGNTLLLSQYFDGREVRQLYKK